MYVCIYVYLYINIHICRILIRLSQRRYKLIYLSNTYDQQYFSSTIFKLIFIFSILFLCLSWLFSLFFFFFISFCNFPIRFSPWQQSSMQLYLSIIQLNLLFLFLPYTLYLSTLCAFNDASLQARVTSTKASVCNSWWNTDVMFDW